jgi:LmbE family N-acetylglucosaminyl deacetylase
MSESELDERSHGGGPAGSPLVGARILLIDRDPDRVRRRTGALRTRGVEHVAAVPELSRFDGSGESMPGSLDVWDAAVWQCGAVDDGEELTGPLLEWYARYPAVPVLVVVAHGDDVRLALAALRGRAADLVDDAAGEDALLAAVELVLRRRSDDIDSVSPGTKRLLVVGAHPDDVEIGVGGTVHRLVRRGWDATVLTLTRGAGGGDPRQRADEAAGAARVLGARLVMEEFPDGAVDDSSATVRAIERVVQDVDPEIVLVHSENDTHQDHRAVHRATLVAARRVQRLACYQSPSATVDFRPNRFVELRETDLEAKLAAIRAHHSQSRTRRYLDEDLIRATARYWGRFSNAHYIEPLELFRASTPTRFHTDGH